MTGLLRHHAARRDGTVRGTAMDSIARGGWPAMRAQLEYLLTRERRC
jgi:hypothetical protein